MDTVTDSHIPPATENDIMEPRDRASNSTTPCSENAHISRDFGEEFPAGRLESVFGTVLDH